MQILNISRKLAFKKKKSWGRNFTGKITVRHKGSPTRKTLHRILDYRRFIWNTPALVINLEKTRYLSAKIALIIYPVGIISYILAPRGLRPGNIIMAGKNLPTKIGFNTLLKHIPLNFKIHNVEAFPGSGAKYVRAGGAWAKLLEKSSKYGLLLLNSGKKKKLLLQCAATFGMLTKIRKKKKYKAGDNRREGKRPSVRGIAMNAVDHPHGGGKGKKSPKQPNYNYKRLLIKGKRTVL